MADGTVIAAALLAEARGTAERAAARSLAEIRPLESMPDLITACALFDRVWGYQPGQASEMQPPLLRALEHSGSYLAGAYRDEEMVAASVAFFAVPLDSGGGGRPGRPGLHSHITGVLPGMAGSGIGAALKWHQRSWALERGIDLVTWTYDPLIARNSFFNVARLGAVPQEYLVEFYGLMDDQLNAGQPTDRALAVWELASDTVVDRAVGRAAARSTADLTEAAAGVRLSVGRDGRPQQRDTDAATQLIGVPTDIEGLRRKDPDAALAWRLALRETMAPLIADPAWQVVDFLGSGSYVFARNHSAHDDSAHARTEGEA
ncbi:putative GNAT superfamily acetyltransferase [Nakamurella sp. UYEF19]|uniref:GNAT family N-acetyltransferase n=1 Tax=Nakamurella sp. UYEF19 TaxID=1756392 RepID=UPI003397F036